MPQDYDTALVALLRAASVEDHEEILRAANASLKINEADELAQHTRIVALLKLDRFDEASRAISEGGAKLESTCALEKAYALYKLGKLEEATAILDTTQLHNRALNHIAAQVAYRAEQFDKSLIIYSRLLGSVCHEDHEININIQAAQAQAQWKGIALSHEINNQTGYESFEPCYNAACANIARGSFTTALMLLQRALALCDASDELSPEEIEEERKPILVQQAFVLAKLGNADRARQIHHLLNLKVNSDPDLKIIGQNNCLVLESINRNPFLLNDQAGTCFTSGTEAKLFNFQSHLLAHNSSIISLLAQKTDGVKKRAFGITKQSRLTSSRLGDKELSVVGAAAETQGLAKKDVLKTLTSLSNRRPHDIGLALLIVQLHLQRGNLKAAVRTLDSLLSRLDDSNNEQRHHKIRFSPGLVALAVVLKKIQKRERSAKAELIEAARYWLNQPAHPALSLLQQAGAELVSSTNTEDLRLAGAIFEKLNEESPASPITSAGLVVAAGADHPSEVERNIASLPSAHSLAHGTKVDELISSGILVPQRCDPSTKRLFRNENSVERATKKRRRKLPKNPVNDQGPDPERWLPLRDRSSYRPKGKKGRKKAADSTQGGLVKEQETIGLVGGGGVRIEKAVVSNASKKKKKTKR